MNKNQLMQTILNGLTAMDLRHQLSRMNAIGPAALATTLLLGGPNANAAMGRTPGNFNVSPTGAATYQIPIWMPKGPNGIQPALSLVYNSNIGNGTMGPGWSLSGLGGITRCNKTYTQDANAAPVALATSDGYCLNGNRLRMTSGTYGVAGSTYQTELADFSNITAYGAAGNGPGYFFVQGKDGLTYEYGNSNDGGSTYPAHITASGSSTPYQWLLNKVRDRAGNHYVVTYGTGQTGSLGVGVPTTIAYTPSSAGSSSYEYTITFGYTVEAAAGTERRYIAGGSTVDTNRLMSVTIAHGATTVRKYSLAYGQSPTTSRYRLTSVTECADAAQTNCLLPTSIGYQNGAAGVASTPVTVAGAVCPGVAVQFDAMDIDHDGFDDLVCRSGLDPSNDRWYVSAGSASGFGAFVDAGHWFYGDVFFDDFLGDGYQDFLRQSSGGIFYRYRWNGSSFTSTNTGVAFAPPGYAAPLSYVSTDVNGDGLADLVWWDNTGSVYTRFNTSSGGVLSFSATPTFIYQGVFDTWSGFYLSTRTAGTGARHMDFNGDGRGDFLVVPYTIDPSTYSTTYGTGTLLSTDGLLTGGTFIDGQDAQAGDWNDDECTDLVGADGYARLSKCNGTTQTSPAFVAVSGIRPIDWNEDGRQDLIVKSGSEWVVYLANGDGTWQTPASTGIPAVPDYDLTIIDKDKDGLNDVVFLDPSAGNVVKYQLHNGASTRPDLATSITDGYGVVFSPTYVSTNQCACYTEGSAATSPEMAVRTPLYVVSQFTASDGVGGTYTKTYTYAGARRDIQGRAFLGFQQQSVSDSRAGAPMVRSYSKTSFPYTGMLYQQDVFQNNGTTLISHTVNTPGLATLDATANNQRYFPNIASTTTDTYEVGGTKNGSPVAQSTASLTYDSYGNVTASTRTNTDKDSTSPASPTYNQSWTTTVTNSFTPDAGSNWCVGIPTQSSTAQSATSVSTLTRTVALTPDYANCRITQQVVEPASGTYKVTTGYAYDGFGNVSSETVTGINMTARQTLIGWGPTGQFPVSVTNPLGQLTTAGYNTDLGLQTTLTDPNGLATSFIYDSFGRKTQDTRPDGTYTTYSYADCTASACQNGDPAGGTGINKLLVVATAKDSGGATIRSDYTHLDQFDRTIVTRTQTLSGYSRVGTQYDALGNVLRQTAPCTAVGCTVYWTTHTYDALNRLTQQSRPISASNGTAQSTTLSYLGLTTVTTDPQAKQSTKTVDPNGWLRRSADHNNYAQTFTYDAFGSVKTVVDSLSNPLFSANYVYGIGAFQTATTDMDLGAWTYTPNALGEVVNYTDAKGSSFDMTYDALSRPLTRFVTGEGTTTFTYGASATSYNIGKLASLSSTGGTVENYTYDTKSRLSQRRITSDAVYDYNYAYASNGQLDTLTYPTSTSSYRLRLKHSYSNGLLNQVKDDNASTVFWQATAMNPRGQISQETLGNGVVTTRTFDAVTGWVSGIQSGVGGGSSLQNDSYLSDLVGNVTQRQNNALGLTENFYYDNLYRLDYSQINSVTNLDLNYDALGNITSRSDIAAGAIWTYHATKKHAVTQAGNASYVYTYDANGNAATRYGSAITWNKYNYPTVITGPGKTLNFSYDANHQRYKQIYANGSLTETTMYVGGLLEKVTIGTLVDYRHYIRVGSQTIAVMSRQSTGTNTTRYMLEDHQGSVANITDAAGASYVGESFTAFGARRNPATWSGPCPCPDLAKIAGVSRMGYTGHEAIGGISMGLNHMNGRVQDAITGRFLSADPYVTEPGNTQNYNRYSYVYNNPLSFVDPSGFLNQNTNRTPNDNGGGEGCPGVCVTAPRIYPGVPDNSRGLNGGESGGRGRGGGGRGGAPNPPQPPTAPVPPGSTPEEIIVTAPQTQEPDKCYAPPISITEANAAQRGDRRSFWESRNARGDPVGEIALSVVSNQGLGYLANTRVVGGILFRSPGSQPNVVVQEARQIGVELMRAHVNAVNSLSGSLSAGDVALYHYDVFATHGLSRDTFGGSSVTGTATEARVTSVMWMNCQ